MAVELIKLSHQVFMVIVTGRLTQTELHEAQVEAAKSMATMDSVRFVVVAEDFEGWEGGDEWGDLTFQADNDAKIERMALVGDKKWKLLVLAFVGQGFRGFPIEYFERGQLAKARAWVLAD
jgi:hypothetical protein